MWTVLKIDRKKFCMLKQDLEKKLKCDVKFYIPKIQVEKFSKYKIKKNLNYDLLGDYIFCFSEKFNKKDIINSLSCLRGLKYFLNGFENSQKLGELNCILANTIKGKGCKIMENKKHWHYWNHMSAEEIEQTRKELA